MMNASTRNSHSAALMTMLESYQVTKSLRAAGLTDEDFERIKLSKKYPTRPFDEWPLTWPDHLTNLPHLFSAMRAFAALRYALVEAPEENGPDQAGAWKTFADTVVEPAVAGRWTQITKNRMNARKSRGYVSEFGMTMRQLAAEFALKPENRPYQAHELWPGFGQYIQLHGLDAERVRDAYIYLDRKRLKYVTFRNYVRDARQSRSH